jgi:hypothetical protein
MPRSIGRQDAARVALAGIRIFNGTAGLVAPGRLARRVGAEPSAATTYAFRLFGIRTVLIGADLFSGDPAVRGHAVRAAVAVHASDVITAATLTVGRRVSPRAGMTLTAISALNLALALAAQPNGRP